MTELVGLPEGGPTSRALVKTHLGIGDARDDAAIDAAVAAVNTQVRSWRVSTAAVDAETWPKDIELGATLLASRVFTRRNSPNGLAQFASDGAVYVSRSDPDVAALLQLGTHQPPTVG